MLIKVFVISIILVAIIMLTLGIKMLFDPDAESTVHSCKHEEENSASISGCSNCQLKDLAKIKKRDLGV